VTMVVFVLIDILQYDRKIAYYPVCVVGKVIEIALVVIMLK